MVGSSTRLRPVANLVATLQKAPWVTPTRKPPRRETKGEAAANP